MRVRHPYTITDDAPSPDGTVHWGGRRQWSAVNDDGTFHVPDDAAHNLDEWADGYGYALSDLIVSDDAGGDLSEASDDTADGSDSDADGQDGEQGDTCDTVKADGEVCGRERPCAYHD